VLGAPLFERRTISVTDRRITAVGVKPGVTAVRAAGFAGSGYLDVIDW
jgi:hypothetical protein